MVAEGNIRKMVTSLEETVNYKLPLYNVLEKGEEVDMNALIGQEISIEFENEIHCIVTGKKIPKTFGEGMSFDAYRNSAQAVESIMRPELSLIHLGIALRDKEWEEAHHNKPHVTYLSLTSEVKVGVTRTTQIPTRWIDQGAIGAIVLAETPYRQAAGLVEVAMKGLFSDKTNWREMLKKENGDLNQLIDAKNKAIEHFPEDLKEFVSKDLEPKAITFPVQAYPSKVKSLKLDKNPTINKVLTGIKGQYLIFEGGEVINLRSHAGYKIKIEA